MNDVVKSFSILKHNQQSSTHHWESEGNSCTLPVCELCKPETRGRGRVWSSLEFSCQWPHGVDCSHFSAINYNHSCTLFPSIVTSLEAFHQHLMPVNMFGAQYVVLQEWGGKLQAGGKNSHTLSLVFQELGLAQHKTEAESNPLRLQGDSAHGPHTT